MTSAANVTINAPQTPIINSVASANPSNCGTNDGTITVTATGTNLQYSIDGGTNWANSNLFAGLAAGTYNVAIRNNTGTCVTLYTSNPVVLTAPSAPSITNVASANPTNCGSADGTITITATGGTAPLRYSIDNGVTWQVSNSFTNLSGGTYQIRTANTDTTCIVTYPNVILINKVAPVIANVATTNVSNCNVADGQITITASSTQGAVQYSINGGTTYQPSNVFSNLAAGTYQIRVRNIDGTCVTSAVDAIITAPVAPTYTSVNPTNPTNCGSDDGTITIVATGGTGVTEYSIDGGNTWFANGGNFTNLASGSYYVRIRNANATCEVLNPSNPVILTAPNAPSITNVAATQPTNCGVNDGTITITATGGTGNYQYSLDGTTWTNTTGLFTGLAGGSYTVRVRNDNGTCAVTGQTVIITDKVAPTITNVQGTNPSNCGVNNGTITITASGTGALQYSINGGSTWQAADNFSNLAAGTYQIRVRNIDGTCVQSATDVTLNAPQLPIIDGVVANDPSNCGINDGSITVTATGVNLEYSIDGGNNYQASNIFTGLAAGTYNVRVRNANGTCVVINTTNPIVLTAPNAPAITTVASTNPTNCGLAMVQLV
ncbi:MAG: hypothetical protein HC803_10365 [Saprospiraceae bacterium]|nr:hypothetical protein [Saprospiraceae bacterium]